MSKKEKIQKERFQEIERENKILLQKMRRIMTTNNNNNIPFEKGSLNKGMRK